MTAPRDPDRIVRAFLEEGPSRLSDRTIERTLAEIHRSHRRAGIGPRRTYLMSRPVLAAIAAALVVAVAAVWAVRSNPAVGSATSPSPQASGISVGAPSPTPTTAPTPSPSGPNLGSRAGLILYELDDPNNKTTSIYSLVPSDPSPTPTRLVATNACCLAPALDGSGFAFGTTFNGRSTSAFRIGTTPSSQSDMLTPPAGVDLQPGVISADWSFALDGTGTTDPHKNGIYVSLDNGGGSIWGDIRRVTSPTGGIEDIPIAFSPDGSKILFIRANHDVGAGDLYTVGLDGSALHKLNPSGVYVETSDAFGAGASFSPDGTQVTFAGFLVDGSAGDSSIYVAPSVSGAAVAIAGVGSWSTSARWSPDGTWIAFDEAAAGPGHQIFLIHPDGSGLKSITAGVAVGFCCSQWSPDGSALLAQGTTTSSDIVDLYLVAADGSGAVQLTHAPGRYNDYTWSPATP